MSPDSQALLRHGIDRIGLELTDAQHLSLEKYLVLLERWNRVYNLTAIRSPDEMVTHHLLDSLAVIPSLLEQRPSGDKFRLLDVGSGGGLPGIVVAICCPRAQVRCVDTVAKKVAFQQQVAAELRLDNLQAVHARVENLSEPHDVVCSRAFASLADFTAWSINALAVDGVWMALKGRYPTEELDVLPPVVQVFHVEQIQVPSLTAERCIVWMRRSS